jgi:CheY-like chemotaxis protein
MLRTHVSPARVLVVDDSEVMRVLVERMLRIDSYIVAHAANGEAALRLLGAETYDVVLTDIFMPDMDGIELLRELRVSAPDIPIVVLTGADRDFDRSILNAARILGAAAVLLKPVAPAQLRATIRAVLRDRPHLEAA